MSQLEAWQLRVDLIVANILLSVALARGPAEVRPEVHLYLADRYARLAHYHQMRGHERRAAALLLKGRFHLQEGGGDTLPPAAAMAMAVPSDSDPVEVVGVWDEPSPPNVRRETAGLWQKTARAACMQLTAGADETSAATRKCFRRET